jgi:hypothetical protein
MDVILLIARKADKIHVLLLLIGTNYGKFHNKP